ncbi:response regulator [Oceanobacillus sp. FSL H7-0719]|uniref:response regulator n=1 Tax=Oceanobacillus sp. FSL H7-0719 TaxID=2954507 RepID=UPI0032490BFD
MGEEILVVDDQPGIRLLLTDILTDAGYNTTTASTGKEALDKLKEKRFSLILLDYKLPIIDGVEVLKKIEKQNLNVPAIVMSGLAEKIEDELKGYPLVKDLLAKPFNIQEIPEMIKGIIEEFKY